MSTCYIYCVYFANAVAMALLWQSVGQKLLQCYRA